MNTHNMIAMKDCNRIIEIIITYDTLWSNLAKEIPEDLYEQRIIGENDCSRSKKLNWF